MTVDKEKTPFLLLALVITCALGATGLAVTFSITKPVIDATTRQEQNETVKKVLPPFEGTIHTKTITVNNEEKTFFLARQNDTVIGIATVSACVGYSGDVVVMVGMTTAGTITGVELLRHTETPGLGAKAGTPEFKEQFSGKEITTPNVSLSVLKPGQTTNDPAHAVDAITAATITSRAFTDAVNEATHTFLTHKKEIVAY